MKLIPYSLAVVVSLVLAVSASADWALYSKRGAAWVHLQQFPTFEQCMGAGKPYADTNGGKISCLRIRWYGLVGITATNVDGGTNRTKDASRITGPYETRIECEAAKQDFSWTVTARDPIEDMHGERRRYDRSAMNQISYECVMR